MGLNVFFVVLRNLTKYLAEPKILLNFAAQAASQKPGQG